jgi:hypothetical protein
MKQTIVKTLAIGALAFATATSAKALTFGNDYVFSGSGIPGNPGPWGTATFTDVAGGVQLTLTGANLTGGEFFGAWYLNLNSSLNAANLNFAGQSNVGVDPLSVTINQANDSFKADGDGFFDIEVDFAQSGVNRMGAGDSITYLITGIAGLTANDFNATSVNGPVSGFYSAVHFQASAGNGQSLWASDADGGGGNTGGPVPEPATYLVLASFIGMAIYLKRRMDNSTKLAVARA